MKAHLISKPISMAAFPNNMVSLLLAASEGPSGALQGIFYVDSDGSERFQSYYDLLENSRKIAACLEAMGLKKGDKLIFQLKDEGYFINLFWGCMLAGIIAVPLTVATTSALHSEAFLKLLNVSKQLSNPVIITEYSLKSVFDGINSQNNGLVIRYFEDVSTLAQESIEVWQPLPEDLAFIQFSSGSTGSSKGVMLTHKNLTCNVKQISEELKFSKNDCVVSWMPLTHDMGLIGSHLCSIGYGISQIKMLPEYD